MDFSIGGLALVTHMALRSWLDTFAAKDTRELGHLRETAPLLEILEEVFAAVSTVSQAWGRREERWLGRIKMG
jgi:hypothetical protein